MFDKICKFFEETANEAKAEIEEEEYLASYDATAGKILRGEEVKRSEDSTLERWACDDPVQKGILDALEDFENIQKETRRNTMAKVSKIIKDVVDNYV